MVITDKFSEVSINYHPKIKASSLPQIHSPKDAETHFRSIWSPKMDHVEESYMLLLNRANRVLGYFLLSLGGTSGTVIDIKVVFQVALKANAHGIIIGHNHPSGNLKPSEADISLTRKLKEAGQIMELPLKDHLILTSEGFYSFADEGLI